MTKQHKKPAVEETVENVIEEKVEPIAESQAVETDQNSAKSSDKQSNEEITLLRSELLLRTDNLQEQLKKQKSSGGKAIGLLALLVALSVGGAGYYFGTQQFASWEKKLNQVAEKATANSGQTAVEVPNFDAEKAQLVQLNSDYQNAVERLAQLEREQNAYKQQINALESQVKKLGANPTAEPTAWLLSDADFLLNNALRKMVLDNDIDTAKSLLTEADNVLGQVADPKVLAVREAVKADLNQLARLNQVDQNNLMQRLAQLANLVDEMPIVENDVEGKGNDDVSDSLEDWQQNIEKSANSFLNHFIRISDKGAEQDKVFIAPNQDIYLRENIRLRLQIAMMTIPRQQNELYKQSLDAVSTWVRSYFDGQNAKVKHFLQEMDELMEQSIYIDAPTRLQSLTLLEQLLNKASKPIAKIQIEEEKALEPVQTEQPSENSDAEKPASSAQ